MTTRFATDAAITAGGALVASGGALWSWQEGRPLERRTVGAERVCGLAVHPTDGRVAYAEVTGGAADVWLATPGAAAPRRVTYEQAAYLRVVGWTPDGDVLVVSTTRLPTGFPAELFRVRPRDGALRRVPVGPVTGATVGRDGEVVLVTGSQSPAAWRGYRGGGRARVWVAPSTDALLAGDVDEVDLGPGNVSHVVADRGRLWFLSDEDGPAAVWSAGPDGARRVRHAGLGEHAARALDVRDGRVVVVGGGDAHLLEAGRLRRLDLGAAPDVAAVSRRLDVDPGGVRADARGRVLALLAGGRPHVHDLQDGTTRRLAPRTHERYRRLEWDDAGRLLGVRTSPDGDQLVELDPHGPDAEPTVVAAGLGLLLDVAVGGNVVVLTTGRQEAWWLRWPPPGGEAPVPTLLARGAAGRIGGVAVAPDGRHVVACVPVTEQLSRLMLTDTLTGASTTLAERAVRPSAPCFTADGTALLFASPVTDAPVHGLLDGRLSHPDGQAVFRVPVDGSAPPRRMPFPPGRHLALHDDGTTVHALVAAVAPADDVDTEDLDPVARATVVALDVRSGEVTTAVDDARALAGPHACAAVPDGAVLLPSGRVVELPPVLVRETPRAAWTQLVHEVARQLEENFWAPEGVRGDAWEGAVGRALDAVARVTTAGDLADVLEDLGATLGTSHVMVHPGPTREGAPVAARLGIDPDPDEPAVVAAVLPTASGSVEARSPLADAAHREGVDLRGARIVSVDGAPVGAEGPAPLLVGAGSPLSVGVRPAGGDEVRLLVVEPVPDEGALRYASWVEQRREHVRAVSAGRIGYVHVPGTTPEGAGVALHDLAVERAHEAVVVDLRANTGGYLSSEILAALVSRPLAHEVPRWGTGASYPVGSWGGRICVVVDGHTGSDGETLAQALAASGAPVVGRRTWGGSVSVWPRTRLADGGVAVQPEFAIVFADGTVLENVGVTPTLDVDDGPRAHLGGTDPALVAAVGVLLDELGTARPRLSPDVLVR